MQWTYALPGAALITFTLLDAVVHTLALKGGGPLAGRVAEGLWIAFLRLRRVRGFGAMGHVAGPAILLAVFLLWALLLWTGWALLFMSHPDAVVNSNDGTRADFWERVYFAGFSITTLGIGDFVPQGPGFRALTVLAAGLGFFLITLFVTYLLAVVEAVTFKRTIAFDILSLGKSPQQLVINAWQASRFQSLETILQSLSRPLVELSQKHLAYRALHYFRSKPDEGSPAVAIAVLDEAITLIECGLQKEHQLDPLIVRTARQSIQQFCDTVAKRSNRPPPPAPLDLSRLQQEGLPVVDAQTYSERLDTLAKRRTHLETVVVHDGRDWGCVYAGI